MQKGGPGEEPGRHVGTDEFGNQYFEELDTNYYINKRWVEFSEAHRLMSLQGTKIPPPWHGWLAYTYDEPPNVIPIFIH
jgi:NADH:ubiquinone oxidoreductase subunit